MPANELGARGDRLRLERIEFIQPTRFEHSRNLVALLPAQFALPTRDLLGDGHRTNIGAARPGNLVQPLQGRRWERKAKKSTQLVKHLDRGRTGMLVEHDHRVALERTVKCYAILRGPKHQIAQEPGLGPTKVAKRANGS